MTRGTPNVGRKLKQHAAAVLLFILAACASGQETNLFPNFTDILIVDENDELCVYLEGGRKDSLPTLQAELDKLPFEKKNEGVLLRFDPASVTVSFAVDVAEHVHRCGIPTVYLIDVTGQHSQSRIEADPYLSALHRMPRYNRFLRILDPGQFRFRTSTGVQLQKDRAPLPSRSAPIVHSLLITLLACASYAGGLYISRMKKPWWALGYIVPIALTALIAAGRLLPSLEMSMPFSFLMKERREYIVMAAATALLLAVPVARLRCKTTAVLASAFTAIFVLHFSLLPFLLPAFNRDRLMSLKTSYDRYGVCLQSTGYTCGPAAAVSALHEFDLPAEEGEIAVFAHSTSAAGTPPELLCRALNKLYSAEGIECHFSSFTKASEMRDHLPVMAVVKLGLLVDHYVTVLRVTDEYVTLADPARGMRVCSLESFETQWRRQGVIMTRKASQAGFHGTGSTPLALK